MTGNTLSGWQIIQGSSKSARDPRRVVRWPTARDEVRREGLANHSGGSALAVLLAHSVALMIRFSLPLCARMAATIRRQL